MAARRAQVQEAGAGGAYTERCIGKALALNSPDARWRLRTSADLPLSVRTLEGEINAFLSPEQQNFIVRKKDGMPAYQLASLIDDQYFGVDFIVRGTDLWPPPPRR